MNLAITNRVYNVFIQEKLISVFEMLPIFGQDLVYARITLELLLIKMQPLKQYHYDKFFLSKSKKINDKNRTLYTSYCGTLVNICNHATIMAWLE